MGKVEAEKVKEDVREIKVRKNVRVRGLFFIQGENRRVS